MSNRSRGSKRARSTRSGVAVAAERLATALVGRFFREELPAMREALEFKSFGASSEPYFTRDEIYDRALQRSLK